MPAAFGARMTLMSHLLAFGGTALSVAIAAAPGPEDPPRDRRKLEAIEMNAAGDAGVVRTVPEYLGQTNGVFHFGAPHCKGKTLGPPTLEQLHLALRSGQLVTINATDHAAPTGDTIRCIATIVFWSPTG
jgi:hypothetical protein